MVICELIISEAVDMTSDRSSWRQLAATSSAAASWWKRRKISQLINRSKCQFI